MSNLITTHTQDGRTIFQTTIPEAQYPSEKPFGSMTHIYSTFNFPVNLSSETDLEAYAETRESGLPGGQLSPVNGTSASIISFKPGITTPLRRTTTLGFIVVLEGIVELRLDSGEVRTMKPGDTCVQRGGMHGWKNVTPNGGWVRMFGCAQGMEVPEIGAKRLEPGFAPLQEGRIRERVWDRD